MAKRVASAARLPTVRGSLETGPKETEKIISPSHGVKAGDIVRAIPAEPILETRQRSFWFIDALVTTVTKVVLV
jgi:hypothetical protein